LGGKVKKLVLLITALMMSTLSFAGSANVSKNASSLGSIAAAWKATHSGLSIERDVHVVYGGEDVSQKHAIFPSAIA
jgi:hypothetical protein